MASSASTPSSFDLLKEPVLARTTGLGALIIYGVGDRLGAGVSTMFWAKF